jgi:ring-1,2-phenylacetyl-CoA epoxidase subunit PaaB
VTVQDDWPLYEIFVGSLHAADDDEMAIRHARDVYTRRNEGVSIWAVRADLIVSSSPAMRMLEEEVA